MVLVRKRIIMIEDKEFNQVAQLSHFGGACAIIYGLIVLCGSSAMWPAVIVLAIVCGIKEFWYDYHYETTEVRGSSLLDFAMYMAGAAFAVGTVLLKSIL